MILSAHVGQNTFIIFYNVDVIGGTKDAMIGGRYILQLRHHIGRVRIVTIRSNLGLKSSGRCYQMKSNLTAPIGDICFEITGTLMLAPANA